MKRLSTLWFKRLNNGANATHARPDENVLPDDTLGLALSGGGIRSAAFCLGLIQALARSGWLRHVDYLSTVSGGGYVGAFLGRYFDLLQKTCGRAGGPLQEPGAVYARVAQDLNDARSAPLAWLRHHSNYLAPAGYNDVLFNVATFWRNFLTLVVVLSLFMFATLGLLAAVSYAESSHILLRLLNDTLHALAPLSQLLPHPWSSAWFALLELAVWVAIVPLGLAYWIVSQDQHESFSLPALWTMILASVAVLCLTHSAMSVIVPLAAVGWALEGWRAVRRREGQGDPESRFRLVLARNHVTHRLAFWVSAALLIGAFALVDASGLWLARALLDQRWHASVMPVLGATTAALVALAPAARHLAGWLATLEDSPRPRRALLSHPVAVAAIVVLLGAVLPVTLISFAAHLAYAAGDDWERGALLTAAAVVACLLLGGGGTITLANRTGPLTVYAARLARVFFGAVNPERHRHPDGANISHVISGDDLPFHEYAPDAGGGPLHLVNVTVNQTVDVDSQRGVRDRQAVGMTVGPAGLSVGARWHARRNPGADQGPVYEPLGPANELHPLGRSDGAPAAPEGLNLREWIAISGAAFSPGQGRSTGLAHSLLFTLLNLRLGYWWNSSVAEGARRSLWIKTGLWPRVTRWFTYLFRAQTAVFRELMGRFSGPWTQYWYLSDGGHFEVTGAYELLRRRVPFVIICDGSRDQHQTNSALAGLARLARIDLGAEIEEVPPAEFAQLGVSGTSASHLGTLSELPARAGTSGKHAVLLRVRYPEEPAAGHAWHGRSCSWVLYLKATCTGDEPADVRAYAAEHHDFPHQSTFDQFFDEPQWESYRRLGAHIGDNLFA